MRGMARVVETFKFLWILLVLPVYSLAQKTVDCTADWDVEAEARSLHISWSGKDDPDANVTVNITSLSSSSEECEEKSQVENFDEKKMTLEVCSNTQYEVNITFTFTSGPFDCTKTAWTFPEAPSNVTVDGFDNTTINVSWTPPRGEIELYSVRVNQTDGLSATSLAPFETRETSSTITDLMPYTIYSVEVAAKSLEWSLWSEPVEQRTGIGVPDAPMNLGYRHLKNTSLLLFWDPPVVMNGPTIEGYDVTQTSKDGSSKFHLRKPGTIHNLNPYTNYTFTVCAKTEKGCGPDSKPLHVQTSIGVPRTPNGIVISSVTNNSFRVQWNELDPATGPILFYTVQWLQETNILGEEPTRITFYDISHLDPYTNYTVKIRGDTEAGGGEWAVVENVTTDVGLPSTPSRVNISSVRSTSMHVEWEAVEPTTGPILFYTVRWEDVQKLQPFQNDTTADTFYDLFGLHPYTDYTVQVRAHTGAGGSDWSVPETAQTEIEVPYPPSDVEISCLSNTTACVQWKEPEPATGPILNYTVQWVDLMDLENKEGITEDTVYNITGLKAYTRYAVRIRGHTAAGQGEWTDNSTFQTKIGIPHPPGSIVASATNTSIYLVWKEPAPSTGPITHFVVYWEEVGDPKNMGQKTTHDVFFNVTRLKPYTNYNLKIRGHTEAGDGKWTQDKIVRTDIGIAHPPRGLVPSSVTDSGMHLEWEEPKPSTGPILRYVVQWTLLDDSKEDVSHGTSYDIEGLRPYRNYIVKVRGDTGAGHGKWSAPKVVETKVGLPFQPILTEQQLVTNTSIKVYWQEPKPSTGPITYYTVQWNSSEDNATDTSYNITGLDPYTQYEIRVQAHTEAGSGNWSDTKVIQTDIGVPFSPRNIEVSETTNTSFKLSWKVPKPSTGPILLYTIEYTESNDTAQMETSESTTEIQSLHPFRNYTVKIRAKTRAGYGAWSDYVTAETLIGVPYPPVDVIVHSVTNISLTVQWKEPNPSTGPLTGYVVEWGKTSDSEKRVVPVGGLSYTLADLDPYTDYAVRVCAVTDAGEGNWTDRQLQRTKVGIPTAPRGLEKGDVTSHSIQVKWLSPERSNGPLLGYQIKCNKPPCKVIQQTKNTVYQVVNLNPYTDYSMQVSALTDAGRGPWTETLGIRTLVGIPAPALLHTIEVENPRTITVVWETRGPYPGPAKYKLQVWQKPGNCSNQEEDSLVKEVDGPKDWNQVDWNNIQQTSTVMGLTPYTGYYFHVVLSTSAGSQRSQQSEQVHTPPDAAGPPRDVRADCRSSSTEVQLTWSPPNQPNGEIYMYLVEYATESKAVKVAVEVTTLCRDHRVTLQGLRPEKPYQISVRALVHDVPEVGKPAYPEGECILPPGIPPTGDVTHVHVKGSGPHVLLLEWGSDSFSDAMGSLLYYAILVGIYEALGNATSGIQSDPIPPWSNFTSGMSDLYQATPPGWNPFGSHNDGDSLKCTHFIVAEKGQRNRTRLRCLVGAEDHCAENKTYCNGPLEPDTGYGMKLRAFTRGGYSETQPLFARTGPAPASGLMAGVVVGVILLMLILSLIAGVFILKKKGGIAPLREAIQSRLGPRPNSTSQPTAEPTLQLEQYRTAGPLTTQDFSDHVRAMMSDSHLRFSQEFESLKRESPQFPCTVAEMDENRSKNRWMNIYPFDHSRVKLLPLGDEPGSDFVNANYIPGASSLREYIASQGPLPGTVDDFWRMIWEQAVTMIVMLTQCVERGKSKCEQYWPASGEARYYGDLQVRTLSESMLSSYVIRVFHVQLGSRERRVKQLHFSRWPDFGCPESPDELIHFVRAVRDHLPRVRPGPVVVHCSAGVGRTGTFIAVDRLSQQLQHSDEIDVYGTVLELRRHRTNMVQTEDQYIYIHLCVRQLVYERDRRQEDEYEDAVYSNVSAQKDTGV